MTRPWSIWIGYEPRQAEAFAVLRESILRYSRHTPVRGLVLSRLMNEGIYTRPTKRRLGRLFDELSQTDTYDGAMSTEFAISRFLVPHLAQDGLALFMDCDMLCRVNVTDALKIAGQSPDKAVHCVKHEYKPASDVKMDNQEQTQYARKNWSSFMIFDCNHQANNALTLDLINTAPGRDLHAFRWLADQDIGELPPEWNYLVGHSDQTMIPKVVHWTEGGPWLEAFRNAPYADEWYWERDRWAA